MDWISVKDRLPDMEGEYLVCFTYPHTNAIGIDVDGYFPNATYIEGGWDVHNGWVTHWQPLPAPPKESSIG